MTLPFRAKWVILFISEKLMQINKKEEVAVLNNLRDKFRRFMIGRYGSDELNRFLLLLTIAFIVMNWFVSSELWFALEVVCVVFLYYRMFSRDINRRFRENQRYLTYQFKVTERFKGLKYRFKEGRKYKIFKCPGCGQKIRIPRGHGKISIRCRKCGHEFMGRS